MKRGVKIGAVYVRLSAGELSKSKQEQLDYQVDIGAVTARSLTKERGDEYRIIYKMTEDHYCGDGNKKPQYNALLDLIRHGKVNFVIAENITRLCRSMEEYIKLLDQCKANGVTIHIPGLDIDVNSPMGDYFYKLLCLMAEWERNFNIERSSCSVICLGGTHG